MDYTWQSKLVWNFFFFFLTQNTDVILAHGCTHVSPKCKQHMQRVTNAAV